MDSKHAIGKIRSIVDHVKVAMMVTLNKNQVMRSRPMQVARLEDDATFWFFTDEYTGKTETLESDHQVVLAFADTHHHIYLSLTGRAYLVDDEQSSADMWNPVLNNWYPGKSKEHLVMIKFVPESAEYWEEAESLWKQIFYAGKAVVTGDKFSKGAHEKLNF